MIKINKTQPAPRYFIYVGTSGRGISVRLKPNWYVNILNPEIIILIANVDISLKVEFMVMKVWKEQLLKDQFDKCCFCESKVAHIDAGDVEHYRPKGESKQTESDPVNKLGYYWLAYEWDNLLIACQRCNRREEKLVSIVKSRC